MSLDEIVNVSISRETAAVERAGFKQALALGEHVRVYDRIRWYSSLAAMVADGFLTDDALYVAASDYFAQEPKPIQIAIGKIQCDEITVEIKSVQDLTEYIISIESEIPGTMTPFSFTSGAAATQTEIADGLAAAINLGTEPLTASNDGDDVKLVNDVSGALFAISINSVALMTVGDPSGTVEDPDAALNALVLVDNTWYGLMYVDRTQAKVLLVAAWAETVYKIFLTASDESDIINVADASDTTSLAALVKASAYARTGVMYHGLAATEYADAAWLGACLTFDPDVQHIQWAFKTLASITVDTLTDTQRKNALDKYANTYEAVSGINTTYKGTMGVGEFIDIILGIDWIRSRMQEDVFQRLVNVPKIPFTNKGIGSVKAIVKKNLEDGIDVGFLDSITSLTAPDAADVDQADKAARLLGGTGIVFAAIVAGAIIAIEITGTVTV